MVSLLKPREMSDLRTTCMIWCGCISIIFLLRLRFTNDTYRNMFHRKRQVSGVVIILARANQQLAKDFLAGGLLGIVHCESIIHCALCTVHCVSITRLVSSEAFLLQWLEQASYFLYPIQFLDMYCKKHVGQWDNVQFFLLAKSKALDMKVSSLTGS